MSREEQKIKNRSFNYCPHSFVRMLIFSILIKQSIFAFITASLRYYQKIWSAKEMNREKIWASDITFLITLPSPCYFCNLICRPPFPIWRSFLIASKSPWWVKVNGGAIFSFCDVIKNSFLVCKTYNGHVTKSIILPIAIFGQGALMVKLVEVVEQM